MSAITPTKALPLESLVGTWDSRQEFYQVLLSKKELSDYLQIPALLTTKESAKIAVSCMCSGCETFLASILGVEAPSLLPTKVAPKPTPHKTLPKSVPLLHKAILYPHYAPATQKAKGLAAMLSSGNKFGFEVVYNTRVAKERDQIQNIINTIWGGYLGRNLILRPCPKSPRHGFTESVKLDMSTLGIDKSVQKALEVWDLTKKEDPEGEMIIMEMVNDPQASAVFVPESGLLCIGESNDGATAGKQTITIPVITYDMKKHSEFLSKAGIKSDDHVFFELVQNKEATYAVQARGGPPIPGGARTEWIPNPVTIKKVLLPTDDLLKWEADTKAHQGFDGIVAWMPGASLACHAAIHSIINNIPFLTREKVPAVGETIHPPVDQLKDVEFSIDLYKAGLNLVNEKKPDSILSYEIATQFIGVRLKLAIAILHNMAALRSMERWPLFLGFAVGWIYKAAAVACIGEARHYTRFAGTISSDCDCDTDEKLDGDCPHEDDPPAQEREDNYRDTCAMSLRKMANHLARLTPLFMHADVWHRGFGGTPWFQSSVMTVKMYDEIASLDPMKAIEQANKVLNCAHNGGWLFTKFLPEPDFMDFAAKQPSFTLANSIAEMMKLYKTDATDQISGLTKRTKKRSASWNLDKVTKVGTHMPIITLRIDGHEWLNFYWNEEWKAIMKDCVDHV